MSLEFLKGAEIIVGLIVLLVSAGWALIGWLHKRADKRNESLKKDIHEDNLKDRTRLGRVEGEVKRISSELAEVEGRMREGFTEVDRRFHEVDLALKDVAKRDDLLGIVKSQAAMDSRLETLLESDRRLAGMIHQQGEAFGKLAAQIYERVKK